MNRWAKYALAAWAGVGVGWAAGSVRHGPAPAGGMPPPAAVHVLYPDAAGRLTAVTLAVVAVAGRGAGSPVDYVTDPPERPVWEIDVGGVRYLAVGQE